MPLKNKYNDYLVEDFICDDDFIQWVSNGENDAFWQEWIKAHPEKKSEITHAKTLLSHLTTTVPSDNTKVKKELWERIDQSSTPKIAVEKSSSNRWLYRIAAAASIAVALWFLIPKGEAVEVITQANKTEKIILADESLITSNENSIVRYDKKKYNQQSRKIELEGEAFFEVERGKTFEVITDQGTVQVLGTSFNVLSREGVFEVICFTGKVKVETPNGASVILTPGESATLKNQQLVENQTTGKNQQPKWLAAYKTYQEIPLSTVGQDIAQFFNVEVIIDEGIQDEKVSADFRFGTLEETAQTITWPLNLKYKITSDTLEIYEAK